MTFKSVAVFRECASGKLEACCINLLLVVLTWLSTAAWAESGVESKSAPAQDQGWRAALEIYGYLPQVDNELPDGTRSKLEMSDILDSLNFTFQALGGLRKGKWLLAVDVFYTDLSNDPGGTIGSVLDLQELGIKAWLVNPFASYRLVDNDDWSLEVLGGARYYWLEVNLKTQELIPDFESRESAESEGIWDAVVGIRGHVELPGRWYLPYRFDVGTGDSDYSVQASAGFGYQFDRFDLQFGYRHWSWRFDDGAPLKEQDWNGLFVGALFRF